MSRKMDIDRGALGRLLCQLRYRKATPGCIRGIRGPLSNALVEAGDRARMDVPSASAGGRRMSLACIHPLPEAARRDAGPAPEGAQEVGGIGRGQRDAA